MSQHTHTQTRTVTLTATEENVVRMRGGYAAPRQHALSTKAPAGSMLEAKLLEFERELILRREQSMAPAQPVSTTSAKDKIIAALKGR